MASKVYYNYNIPRSCSAGVSNSSCVTLRSAIHRPARKSTTLE
jgi:hypothetical protein